MNVRLLLITLLSLSLRGFAQQSFVISPLNADCSNPIVLSDSVFGPTNALAGFGQVMEFKMPLYDLYSFEVEHNTVWYKFTASGNCTLTFDIIPQSINDDYDFLLFRYTGNENDFCNKIKSHVLRPIRSCISANDKSIDSKTGLSVDAKDEFIKAGYGKSYSKALKVKKGEIYYLVLDNVHENGSGHTLKLHYSGCEKPVVPVQPQTPMLSLTVVDKVTNEMINAEIKITGYGHVPEDSVFAGKDLSACMVPMEQGKTYLINVSAKGYMLYSNTVKSPANGTTTLVASLEKIEAGKSIVFDNIYFYGGSPDFLPGSEAALEALLKFMQDNPTVKIEIQGHINWPMSAGNIPGNYQPLSENRAKAVYNYLVTNKIDANRMKHKGYGNSKMVYPNPITEVENQKNRRVEIVILPD
jgi:outer membrane protein OmpA-like peptidoglycan-associated protein